MDVLSTGSVGGSPRVQLQVNSSNSTGVKSAQASEQVQGQIGNSATPYRSEKEQMDDLRKAIEAIQGPQRFMEFSVHKETHAIMIKVMNKETGELIREVPPQKILDLAARMMEITGMIVDKKV